MKNANANNFPFKWLLRLLYRIEHFLDPRSHWKSQFIVLTFALSPSPALLASAKDWKMQMMWMGGWRDSARWRSSRHYSNYSSDALFALKALICADAWCNHGAFPCINFIQSDKWSRRKGLKELLRWLVEHLFSPFRAAICTSTADKNHRRQRCISVCATSNIIWSPRWTLASHMSRKVFFATVDSKIAFPIVRRNPMWERIGSSTFRDSAWRKCMLTTVIAHSSTRKRRENSSPFPVADDDVCFRLLPFSKAFSRFRLEPDRCTFPISRAQKPKRIFFYLDAD